MKYVRKLTLVGAEQEVSLTDLRNERGRGVGAVLIENQDTSNTFTVTGLFGGDSSYELGPGKRVLLRDSKESLSVVKVNGTGICQLIISDTPDELRVEDVAVTLDATQGKLKVVSKTINYSDFTAAAGSEVIDGPVVPADKVFIGCAIDVVTLFDDFGAVTSSKIDVGDGSDADCFVHDIEVLAGVGTTGKKASFPDAHSALLGYSPSARATKVTLTNTGANVDLHSAGQVRVHAFYFDSLI